MEEEWGERWKLRARLKTSQQNPSLHITNQQTACNKRMRHVSWHICSVIPRSGETRDSHPCPCLTTNCPQVCLFQELLRIVLKV